MSRTIVALPTSMRATKTPLLTLFAIPKPFTGSVAEAQRRAVSSWKALGPEVRIVLMGDEPGVRATAAELGVEHVADLRTNQRGTPILSDAFVKANRLAATPLLAYVNADIVLLSDFLRAVARLHEHVPGEVLMIGRRTELPANESAGAEDARDFRAVADRARRHGRLGPVVCKDYFVFRTGQYAEIPDFLVGRGNWDNWVVATAKRRGVPVVDGTEAVTAIHQTHDYAHVRGGRRAAYVTGREALENLRLAGGLRLIDGCDASHLLAADSEGLRPAVRSPFWVDIRAFLSLVRNLAFGG